MENFGYVKLFRKFLKWEWYQKSEMVHLFLHFLLLANHEDGRWQGQVIKRGQFITGRKSLKRDTRISERTIRTCIERLKTTNEITTEPTNRFTLITIVNWEDYQNKPTNKTTNTLTNKRPTNDQLPTTNKNSKNDKNNKEEKKENKFSPPSLDDVKSYCLKRENNVDAENFINFYESKGWLIGKNKMKDWQAAIRTWENRDKKVLNNNEIEIPEYAKKYIK